MAPEYRRQGLAQKLMGILEEITIKRCVPQRCVCCGSARRMWLARCCVLTRPRLALLRRHDGYFVDLFVRKSNSVAIGMYEKARGASKKRVWVCLLTSACCAVRVLYIPPGHRLLLGRGGRVRCAPGAAARSMRSALTLSARADMRKAMPRDVLKKSIIPLKRPVKPSELDDD